MQKLHILFLLFPSVLPIFKANYISFLKALFLPLFDVISKPTCQN